MEDVQVLAESFEQQQRKLHNVHKKSSTTFEKAPSLRKSAYAIKVEEDHGFCGQTMSFYNAKLRMICNICCIVLIATFTITAYSFFFRMHLFISVFSGLNDVTYWYVMILMGRMGYLTDGVEERDPTKCRHHYQSSYRFIIDMITCFPLFLFTSLVPNNLRRLGLINQGLKHNLKYRLNSIYRQKSYLRMHWILHYLQLREDEPGSSTLVFRAYKFFLLVAFTWFGLGCMWFFCACLPETLAGFTISQCVKGSWMHHAPNQIIQRIQSVTNDTSVMQAVDFHENRLLNSLYWSMATASSTGYGDVRAYTLSEKVFSVFAMFIGMAIMYGMTIGGLTSLLTNFDARRSTFLQKYQAFKDEVKTLDVCPEIKDMCIRYYDYMWHRYEGQSVHSTGFLQMLPENLRLRFYESCFKPLTGKADLFGELEPAFNRNLALVSEPMVYLKDQFVEKSGKIGTHMTFLKSGMLEVLDEYEEEAIANLNPGKLFGQILLVFDLPRVSSIRCKTNCEVFVLNKHDFRMVLSDYPESARSFVAAAREKCIGGRNFEWPIPPPTEEFFTTFIQKSNKEQRRISTLANATYHKSAKHTTQAKHEMERQARAARRPSYRRQSVATANYDDDLVRLGSHGRKASRTLEEQAARAKETNPDAKASLVDFLLFGQGQRRSSTKLNDGTQLIADNANFADLQESQSQEAEFIDPDQMNFMQRLNHVTIINPEGMFKAYWQNYIFILSIFTGLYTSYMAFFNTTPGKETLVIGEANTATSGVLPASLLSNIEHYYPTQCAGEVGTFGGLLNCSQSMGPLDAWIWKNGKLVADKALMFSSSMAVQINSSISVTVPAMYDMTPAPLTTHTSGGIGNILLSYLLIDVSFYLNIFVNLRTEIKTPNGYLTSFKSIFKDYNKWNRLYLDVLAVFPFEVLAAACSSTPLGVGHAWAYLRLTRVLCFVRFVSAGFSRFEYSLDVNINRVRAFKVVIYLFFVTHIFSCIFYFGACSYYMQSHLVDITTKCRIGSWAWSQGVAYNSSQIEDYVKTIYWATTTMSSTGYGDITSYTTSGRLISMLVMLLGTFMYGWIIAVIASTVSNNEAAETSYSNKLEDTKKYLKIHDVPKALINRVMDVRYIEWQRYQGTAKPGGEVIGSDMGENFKTSLLYEVVHEHIIGLPFFKGIDESFIATLCACAHTYHYSEGDIIIYTGDLSRNLCIVRSGHCDVVTEDLSTIVEHLKPGDYFGEIEVLFGCGSPRTVVADTFCEIIILSREDIDIALKSFPMVGHHFHKIENDIKYKESMISTMKDRERKAMREKLPERDMTGRYNVVNVIDEVSIYSSRAREEQFIEKQSGMICFNSDSKYYVYYELYRVIAIVFTLATVPLLFSVRASSGGLMGLQYTLDFLCLVDQIVKGFTGFYNKKRVYVTDTRETWMNYLKGSFAIDLLSWFPFELFVLASMSGSITEQQYRMIGLFRILRILQFYKIKGFIDFWLHDIRTKRRWAFHVQSLLVGLTLHHWVACILFVMSCRPSFSNVNEAGLTLLELYTSPSGTTGNLCSATSWLGKIISDSNKFPSLNLANSTLDQYVVSLYWGSATLVAVGYGDISAGLVPEMAIATLIMLAGTVYYSYVIGEIGSNIQMADIRRGHFKGRLSDILHFFKVYEISKEIKDQVYKHYCYMWDRTKGVSPNELLTGLPPTIKTSVCQSMYIDMIKEAFDIKSLEEFHDDKDTIGFFRLVSTMIKPCLFLKGNVICRKGDAGEEMFFIQRGYVNITNNNNESAKTLGPGQHFGEVALLCTCNRTETVTAVTNCDITVLSRKDLDGVLSKFPQFSSQLEKTANDRRLHGVDSITYNQTPSEVALMKGDVFDHTGKPVIQNQGLISIVLDRDHWISRCCNQVTIILAVLSACLALIQISFHNHSYAWYILAGLTDIWFLCDMLICFHTTYLDRFKTNVNNQLRVHRHYFRAKSMFVVSAFALDAVANAPLGIIAFGWSSSALLPVLAGLRLTRVLRMHKVLSIFNDWENDIRRDALIARIYKFCLCGMFTINFLSCFWYLTSCPKSICVKNSWASVPDTDYIARDVRGHNALPWVDGLYWAVATMTTTGYGDISPETQAEMFYACIAMVIGKMFVGYVLGMVGATLANDESLRVWYEGNVNIVKSAMKDLNFKSKLSDHIVQYYNYMWLKNHGTNVMKLFPDLAFSLRADIYTELCWDLLQKVELFKGCPENFMRHVCTAMTPIAYMPGDYITFEGDIRTEMYIIRRGVAEAFQRKNGEKVPVRLVTEGEVFLPESILCKVKRPCSLQCVPGTYVDVFVLTMETLQEVLVYYPDMRKIILDNAAILYPNLEM